MEIISIIIPLFNREEFIEETLFSLIKQTYINWEAVVVDDKSTDNSTFLVERIAENDKRIQLYKNDTDKKGAPVCRNIGLKKAKGDYIIFLDSDDLLSPNCLNNRISIFRKKKNCDFLVFNGLRFRFTPYDLNLYISSFNESSPIVHFLAQDIPWITLNPIYRKESLISKQVYWHEDIKGFQDIQFHVLALTKGLRYEIISSEPDCFWRIHDSGNIGSDMFQDRDKLLSHIKLATVLKSYLLDSNNFEIKNIKTLNYFIYRVIQASIDRQEYHIFKNSLKLFSENIVFSNYLKIRLIKIVFFFRFFLVRFLKKFDISITHKIRDSFTIGKNENTYFLSKKYNK